MTVGQLVEMLKLFDQDQAVFAEVKSGSDDTAVLQIRSVRGVRDVSPSDKRLCEHNNVVLRIW